MTSQADLMTSLAEIKMEDFEVWSVAEVQAAQCLADSARAGEAGLAVLAGLEVICYHCN